MNQRLDLRLPTYRDITIRFRNVEVAQFFMHKGSLYFKHSNDSATRIRYGGTTFFNPHEVIEDIPRTVELKVIK